MKPQELLTNFALSSPTVSLSSALSKAPFHVHAKGLAGSSPAFIMAAMAQKLSGHHHLVVAHTHEDALSLANDLETLQPEGRVMVFPSPYHRHNFVEAFDSNQIQQRTEVLERFARSLSSPHFVLTYPEALLERVVSKAQVASNTFLVKVGDGLDLDFITDFLVEYHFERVDFVYEPGTFSLRGGIVDVFSFAAEKPFRIELLGDKVESIKQFDPETQLSERRLQSVHLTPNFEHAEVANEGRIPVMAYFPNDMVVWSQGINDQLRALDTFEERIKQVPASAPSSIHQSIGQMITQQELLQVWAGLRVVDMGTDAYFGDSAKVQFHFQPQPVFNKRFDLLADKLEENERAGVATYIFSDSKTQLERIYAILDDIGRHPVFEAVYHGLQQGFVDKDQKLAFYTEHEIFNRYKKPKGRRSYNQEKAITLKELYQLQPGDYVVHIDHGIGQFSGLEKMEINGKEQEAIRLLYKGGDLLYINIHSLHKIARFTGQEGHVPTMHRLGGQAWNKLKEKTKGKVKDIARDLIKLYAERKSQPGFAFSPDGYLQNELEASFIYEDTPDQAKVTADIKADMEQAHPMDRLVCGDVGFGKTEVAIRAAFKAAVDGKQTAVLVPTTVLALQHFKTFGERLSELPVTVDYINRFKSDTQVKKTLEKLAEGKIDILVGTHRLLSSDVVFKDLGLLIVDEEQKFGVSAKEKIKSLKVNVDTLTLTATPIPRTLQFSLMGARDLSTIHTPPPNRQPIDTRLHVWDEGVLSEAVNRELARAGQVFFVHNRIADIFHFAGIIERLCPQARVAVAHGQMEGHKLEEIMVAFVDGFYDVLVSTSIIESGLDISNANTIIVNAAHNFGLSDLYQMRGRVGRSNKKAYCYLFTPPKHLLSDTARRRLSAIEQHSDLGSGFHIAMRDMDIRGAGNILGAEQSGFIAEIGVEMYHKILNEALAELKESEFKDLFAADAQPPALSAECQIDTDMTLLIPDQYVSNINERMNLYRQLNDIDQQAKLDAFSAGLEDRFGPLPEPTVNLLLTMQLKWQARRLGIQKILLKSGKMFLNLPPQDNDAFYQSETFGRFLAYLHDHPKRVRLKQKESAAQLVIDGISNVRKALHCLCEMDVYEKVT